jgi:hypothetical protein
MENLLLLLLRTAAVLFLALALARPTFSDARLTLDHQASHLFLLLDNSASTGARDGPGPALESATGMVSSLLSEIGDDDPVTLVVTNDEKATDDGSSRKTGRARLALRGTRDHAKVRQYVGALKPAAARADIVDALKTLEEAVPSRGAIVPKVAVLTDLQRASFEDADARGAQSAGEALRATLVRLEEKGAEVVMMPFGRPVANVAITSLRAQDSRDIVQGALVTFEAEVRNFGDRAVKADVRFLLDGAERGEVSQPVVLPARPAGTQSPPVATAHYTVSFREDEVGLHVLEARLPADALGVDDVRTFVFEVRKPIRVLAVDGDWDAADPRASETYALKGALAIKEDGPIRVDTRPETEFESETDLSAWDLIVLANVKHPAVNESMKRRLQQFVARGGALMLSVGDNVAADVWNGELHDGGAGLLPARLGPAVVDPAKRLRIDLSENRHPILADITNPGSGAFFGAPYLWGRMSLESQVPDRGSRFVLSAVPAPPPAADGRPAPSEPSASSYPILVERQLGRGRILLVTTTLDDAWGKLSGDFLFPVLLHESVYHLTARGNAERNLLGYQLYTRAVPANVQGVEARYPDGSPAPVTVDPAQPDTPPYITVTDTSRLGAYRLTIALRSPDILASAPPPVPDAFSVNLAPAESDLDRLRPEEVQARWPDLLRMSTTFAQAAEVVRPKGGEFHAPMILAAILCLLGEVLLVRRISKSRAAAA